jgi:uncharacterized protein YuzE
VATVRVTLDKSVDAAYVYLRPIGPRGVAVTHSVESPEAAAMINLDLDHEGRPIGIEVIDASRGLPAELLDQAERID